MQHNDGKSQREEDPIDKERQLNLLKNKKMSLRGDENWRSQQLTRERHANEERYPE